MLLLLVGCIAVCNSAAAAAAAAAAATLSGGDGRLVSRRIVTCLIW